MKFGACRANVATLSPRPDGQLACLSQCPKCLQATQCHGSRCFSSVKVIDHQVVFERGCLEGGDNGRLQCSTSPSLHQAIYCCSQDLCNSNVTKSQLMSRLLTGNCSASRFKAVLSSAPGGPYSPGVNSLGKQLILKPMIMI